MFLIYSQYKALKKQASREEVRGLFGLTILFIFEIIPSFFRFLNITLSVSCVDVYPMLFSVLRRFYGFDGDFGCFSKSLSPELR